MEDIFVVELIKEICKRRGWTYYRLSQETGIPHSSLTTMLNKNHIPSMNSLIKICRGFDMPLSQFFLLIEQKHGIINSSYSKLMELWHYLDAYAKDLVMSYIYGLVRLENPVHGKLDKNDVSTTSENS